MIKMNMKNAKAANYMIKTEEIQQLLREIYKQWNDINSNKKINLIQTKLKSTGHKFGIALVLDMLPKYNYLTQWCELTAKLHCKLMTSLQWSRNWASYNTAECKLQIEDQC